MRTLAWIFAVVFVAIGVLGFVPGVTSDEMLFGIFHVDALHNSIHIISGVIAGLAALMSAQMSKVYFIVFGLVYGIVAVIGLVQVDTVLGLLTVNMADNILHIVIAVLSLLIGFTGKTSKTVTIKA